MEQPSGAHIAILPTPGLGHLIPAVEFAKRLHHHHFITTTFIVPVDVTLAARQAAFLSTLPPSIHCVILPAVDFDDLADEIKVETRISLTIKRSLPSIRDAVKTLHERHPLSAFVVDLFGTDGFQVAVEFDIPRYVFFASNAMVLSLLLHLPELDEAVKSEYYEVSEKFRLPGCVPIHGSELIDPFQDRKNDAYKWFLHHAKNYRMADGILLNSFKELERGAIGAFQKGEVGKGSNPKIYPIGPLTQNGSKLGQDSCIAWLNQQPIGSILLVSFGSGGTLSQEQINELALGLELSEEKFLWVIRCPNDKSSSASYFNRKNTNPDDPLAYLPEGFLERTGRQGLVVVEWAPQAEILAHEATGGFLSHCGWNSTLESVVGGVPMIAWPLFAEQRMNAVMVTEDARVAVRVKFGEKGIAGRVAIAEVVKELMQGEEGKRIRNGMRVLKNEAAEAIGENGESARTLAELSAVWKTKTRKSE